MSYSFIITGLGIPHNYMIIMNKRCSGTPAGATALLLREQTRPDWCSDTPAGATELLLRIVPSGTYYTAPYSVLMIGLGSQIDI